MRRKMSENEKQILRLLKENGHATYDDIEPRMEIKGHDKYWTTFSTICSLIQSGVVQSENKHPSKYTLTAYGRVKALEVV
jgi:predicted transcriptional regulator